MLNLLQCACLLLSQSLDVHIFGIGLDVVRLGRGRLEEGHGGRAGRLCNGGQPHEGVERPHPRWYTSVGRARQARVLPAVRWKAGSQKTKGGREEAERLRVKLRGEGKESRRREWKWKRKCTLVNGRHVSALWRRACEVEWYALRRHRHRCGDGDRSGGGHSGGDEGHGGRGRHRVHDSSALGGL